MERELRRRAAWSLGLIRERMAVQYLYVISRCFVNDSATIATCLHSL